MPSRRAVARTRRAISPRLATSTEFSTRAGYYGLTPPPPGDLGQCLNHLGVVLGRGVQAQPFERRHRPAGLGGRADQVVEGVGGADDPAADRRLMVLAAPGPALVPHDLRHPVEHPGLVDDAGPQFGDATLLLGGSQ